MQKLPINCVWPDRISGLRWGEAVFDHLMHGSELMMSLKT